MEKTLTRRSLIGRAGLALGGAVTLGVLNACSSDTSTAPCPAPQQCPEPTVCPPPTECPPPPEPGPQVADLPYQTHLAPGYQLDAAAIRQAAYHQYYAGGCCHGAYNALMKHLADTAGAPFNLLPLDFGMFGGGGIAAYGSICGAVLGGILTLNSVVRNAANTDPTRANVRNRMMVELMRWYEGFAFPAYQPTAIDSQETGLTLSFAAADLPSRQTISHSHLCHASVTIWCAANGNVPSNGPDKKARCARLTADVAGKVADMLNGYLASGGFSAGAANLTAGCVGCHSQTAAAPAAPVAAGMECASCHPTASHTYPAAPAHDPAPASCKPCH